MSWYSRGLPGSAEFRSTVMRLADLPAVLAVIDRFYDRLIEQGIVRSREAPDLAQAEAA